MSRISPGLYAQWRARGGPASTLAERLEPPSLNEHLMQLIWHHQRLRRDQLRTTSGQPVTVFHPGFWNREAGPDFRSAVVQIGDSLAQNGDVEIDLVSQNWQLHRHAQNPDYRTVILHVVWEEPAASVPVPTLAIKTHLDAPLEELAVWLRQETSFPLASLQGKCAPSLGGLTRDSLNDLLRQAAEIRLQTKSHQLEARAKQAGWEQALWEGVFGALGFKRNIWPMQRIAESLPQLLPAPLGPDALLLLQARLLGVSGLLPGSADEALLRPHPYWRKIWDLWWRERESYQVLPISSWHLAGIRPANHPQRRLALAAHWLTEMDLPSRLTEWFAAAQPGPSACASLRQLLLPCRDAFWSRHWTIRSGPTPEPQPMVGPHRITDLAVNVFLPWFWIRSARGRNATLQERAENLYFAWPKAEDNAVLRLARQRLFGTERVSKGTTAAKQQGLLQVVRDFCDFSNAACQNCPFPDLILAGVCT